MSTLWTPEGEYRPKAENAAPKAESVAPKPSAAVDDQEQAGDELSQEQHRQAEQLAQEIRDADPATIIANHCYGLFELAAIHLSSQPPQLTSASLAIDALGGVMDKVGDRLGDYAGELTDGLAQLRLAFIQLSAIVAGEPKDG